MFTGIVRGFGEVESVDVRRDGARVAIVTDMAEIVSVGDSVAVNGVCLTATSVGPQGFTADASLETLSRTTTGNLKRGNRVNLEPAMSPTDRFGGHFVQGHVDGVGTIARIEQEGNAKKFWFGVAPDVIKFFAPKGSVTVDGISLTIVDLLPDQFSVAVIPHTMSGTTLPLKKAGDRVNIEADMIAKHIFHFVGKHEQSGSLSSDLLKRAGFFD